MPDKDGKASMLRWEEDGMNEVRHHCLGHRAVVGLIRWSAPPSSRSGLPLMLTDECNALLHEADGVR
jgi:hypothetical protein